MQEDPYARGRVLLPVAIATAIIVFALATGLLLLRQDLHATRGMLAHAQSQLIVMDADLSATRSELAAMDRTLSEVRGDLADVAVTLNAAHMEIAQLEAALESLQVNYERTVAGYGYVLADPSYAEMIEFLAADETSSREYHVDDYNCTDFSADVKTNAASVGLRCAYVNVYFPDGIGHAIVAFDTTDNGVVVIEPQTNEEVNLRVGRSYNESIIPNEGYYYPEPDYDDTVLRYRIIW